VDSEAGQSAIERYLSDRGLDGLLAEYLKSQIEVQSGDRRIALAERLARLYVRLLGETSDPESRERWVRLSQSLLERVPEAQTDELRIDLAKARYLRAEQLAERSRLRMATEEEVGEARRVLESVRPIFGQIGTKLNHRVDLLERRERRTSSDPELIRQALSKARRLRSLSMYYEGWTQYYLALLTGATQQAQDALRSFGWLLNASGGRPATLERLRPAMLRHEHVARSAMGAAMCLSLRGNDTEAMHWLDTIAGAEDVPKPVIDQLFSRRLIVLSRAGRWAEVQFLVERRRQPDRRRPATPLAASEARLVAVLAMDALERLSKKSPARDLVRSVAQTGLGDLVAGGEISHVLDLVARYGQLPLGEGGFIVSYVDGLVAYDKARAAHRAGGEDDSVPTGNATIASNYLAAAGLLSKAAASDDAERFVEQRARADLLAGLSFYYADRLEEAADRLERAWHAAGDQEQAEQALWMAVLALERAVDRGAERLTDQRDRLVLVYLQTYPRSDRAAIVLMKWASRGSIDAEQALAILLGVQADSEIYEAARRHASRLLYAQFRRSNGAQRDFAALRFAEVAEELLAMDARTVRSESGEAAQKAAASAVLRARQIADALLGTSTPDVDRAEAALNTLESVAASMDMDLGPVAQEVVYRRLQIALVRGDMNAADELIARAHAGGGHFAEQADRFVYQHALEAWSRSPADADLARRVVRTGAAVMVQFQTDENALNNPVVRTLHDTVAAAAALVWRKTDDEQMRDVALRIDKGLIDAGRGGRGVLHRYAQLSEQAGQPREALDAWLRLLSGSDDDSPDWYEARYNSIRLQLVLDPSRARAVMDRHTVLHPDYGPEPWGPLLRDLDGQIAAAPVVPLPEGGGP